MGVVPGLLALAITGAVSLRADMPAVRAGGQATVGLEVVVKDKGGTPIPHAAVSVSSQVGSIGTVKEVAPGRYHATFTAPREKYPQVALLVADVKVGDVQERAWLPLPILGVETLKLSTKPRARVDVTVAERAFGPLQADATGSVSVPVEVPPGVEFARVRSVDRLGNLREKTVPLSPPPFLRVRLLPGVGVAAAASWADKPLRIEVYAVEPNGKPNDNHPPSLSATAGTLSPIALGAAGVWICTYVAPDRVGEGQARLRASMGGASPVSESVISLRPGPPARVALQPGAEEARAGREPLQVELLVTDAKDNALPSTNAQMTSSLGTVEPAAKTGSYRLLLPTSWAGQTSVTLTAHVGDAQGQRTFPLRAGPPAQGSARLDRHLVYPGEAPLTVELELRDVAGNLPQDIAVSASSDVGTVTPVEQPSPGHYAFRVAVPEDAPMGEGHVRAGVADAPALVSAPFSVLPLRRSWGLSLGAWLAVQTNFRGSSALSPTLDLAIRPARIPLEAVLQVRYGLFRPIRRPYLDAGQGVEQVTQLQNLVAMLGARAWLPLSLRWSFHGAALVGAAWTRAQTHLENSATPDLRFPAQAISFALSASGGFGVRLGPGRLMAELQFVYAPISTAALQGNPGGLGVSLGYLVELH